MWSAEQGSEQTVASGSFVEAAGSLHSAVLARHTQNIPPAEPPVPETQPARPPQVPKTGAFAFLLDVDFVPSPGMYDDLTRGPYATRLASMRASYVATGALDTLVLPAYEPTEAVMRCRENDARLGRCKGIRTLPFPMDREQVRAMEREGTLEIFYATRVRRLLTRSADSQR